MMLVFLFLALAFFICFGVWLLGFYVPKHIIGRFLNL